MRSSKRRGNYDNNGRYRIRTSNSLNQTFRYVFGRVREKEPTHNEVMSLFYSSQGVFARSIRGFALHFINESKDVCNSPFLSRRLGGNRNAAQSGFTPPEMTASQDVTEQPLT